MTQQLTQIEKLKGRENFDNWKIAAKSYLVIKSLWKFIDPPPNTTITDDENLKTISELTLLVDPINYPYIADATTAKSAWKTLCEAYQDTGTSRKVDTLQRLVTLYINGGIL